MGLGVFWTVIIFAVFVIVVPVIIVEICKKNDRKTNRKILWAMLIDVLEQTPGFYIEDVFGSVKDRSVILNEETYFVIFEWLFSQMPSEELKTLVVIKPDHSEDPYNMWQDVQDILRHARQVKVKNLAKSVMVE